jgi:tetratricopeptide (TPR) repeat protein
MKILKKIKTLLAGNVKEPELISCFDLEGNPYQISKQEWQLRVLPQMILDEKNNPDKLYDVIVMALHDGFFDDILEATERLVKIDSNQERSHVVRGVTLMKLGQLDLAEQAIKNGLERCGETGSLLTNLAKIYAERGDEEKAQEILWHSIEIDPNSENGLSWWLVLQHEKGGQAAYNEALKTVAAIKGSWRAQLWQARQCLEDKNIVAARKYYQKILANDYNNDALTTISGDLGNNGYIEIIIELLVPVYDPEKHDVETGFNILKAYAQLKKAKRGLQLIAGLSSLKRPDIKEKLLQYSDVFIKM